MRKPSWFYILGDSGLFSLSGPSSSVLQLHWLFLQRQLSTHTKISSMRNCCLQTCQAHWVLLWFFTVRHCRFVLQLFAKRQNNQYKMKDLSWESETSEMGKKILLTGLIWVTIYHNPWCLRVWPRACVFLDTQNMSWCSLHSPPNSAFRNDCVRLFCDGFLGIILRRREVHEICSHKVK